MRIVQVCARDFGGGAEKIAWSLFSAYRTLGHESWLTVGQKRTQDPYVAEIPRSEHSTRWERALWTAQAQLARAEGRLPGIRQLRSGLATLAGGLPGIERALGREDFNYPKSRELLKLVPQKPDIVHAHNLHGGYFDLRYLPRLSYQAPLVLTLHDSWLLTGHCSHSLGCERWKTGCGHCPDLSLYPAVRRDATVYNWRRKRRIYERSRLYVAAPSRWLMEEAKQSILGPVIADARLIPNGVDLAVFHPGDKRAARFEVDIRPDAKVLLFTANGTRRNMFKDYQTMRSAVALVAERLNGQPVLFIALGEAAAPERMGGAEVRFVPYQNNPEDVARYYQMADVYVHAARAETWGLTITEALACGTPVVATAVGGIPEQIDDGLTGFLVAPQDAEAMAERITRLLDDEGLHRRMSVEAAAAATHRFDFDRQVDAYLDWYRDILSACAPGPDR